MLLASTIAGIVSLLLWLYLLLLRGGFWRVSRSLPPSAEWSAAASHCRVAVILPARNEAEFIGRSIISLLCQSGPPTIHIFLVDDSSSDGTAEIARQAAVGAGNASALTIIQGAPLPPGWTGKLWAVQQGVESARAFQPQFLLLTDADILHGPENVALLVSMAESSACDLASLMVKLHCVTLTEKFLIPAFVFFFFKLYPPAWISSRSHQTAGAAGGSILVRPEALDRAGGVEAIRNQIIDDCALARLIKAQGGKLWLGLTHASLSLRPYRKLSQVGSMISRTAFSQLQHSVLLLMASLIGLAVIYLLPLLLLFSHHFVPVTLGAVGWLLMALAYLPMVRFYHLNPWWTLTLPLTAIFYMGATLHSAINYWTGRGGQWKGRSQDAGAG